MAGLTGRALIASRCAKFFKDGDFVNLGIGLPLAREIVRRHHGDIRAVQEASGTAFVVTLPILNCVEKTEN